MTTPKQAQLVFPSFLWLLRDVMLDLPKDCSDINDYFRKRIFSAGSTQAGDKAQEVADTILKCFPSFEAFALPLPSVDPDVVHNLSSESIRGFVNPEFLEGVEDFEGIVKRKLEPKKTPDGKGFLTGEALASMVESYVQTLNTPGAVPSIAGAWDMFITQKGEELLNLAKTFYYHEMKDDINWRFPCDSAKIREVHATVLDDVIKSVFESAEAKDIPDEKLQQHISELTAEAEDTESSWLQENTHLTEQNCDTHYRELKENLLAPMKSMWEGRNQGIAEKRIRSAYEEVMRRFKRECRGCGELIKNYAMLYKEELDKEMREDIELVRHMGTKRDEITAYEIMIEEQKYVKQENEAETERIKKRLRDIDEKMEELTVQNQEEQHAIYNHMAQRLQEQKEELESKIRENQAKAKMDMEGIESMMETLEKHQQELRRVIERRDDTIRRLRQQNC